MSALVEPSHEEPIGQLAARDRQIAAMAGQLAELVEVNDAGRQARAVGAWSGADAGGLG